VCQGRGDVESGASLVDTTGTHAGLGHRGDEDVRPEKKLVFHGPRLLVVGEVEEQKSRVVPQWSLSGCGWARRMTPQDGGARAGDHAAAIHTRMEVVPRLAQRWYGMAR
jgi:hypothetical protein